MSLTNPNKKHIILIGFRGVGKSTIGELIASQLSFPFYDSDSEIVKKRGKTIVDIFSDNGENYFRQIEKDVIDSLCQKQHPLIIATGGGAILSKQNRDVIQNHGFVVLLKAPATEIYKRINEDKERPPLTNQNLFDEIKDILKLRDSYYHSINNFEIDTSLFSPLDITNQIIQAYDQFILRTHNQI